MTSGELAATLRRASPRPRQEVYVRGEVMHSAPAADPSGAAGGKLVEVQAEEVQLKS